MNYKFYLNKANFIDWMDSIIDTDPNPLIRLAAEEISYQIKGNCIIKPDPSYDLLYRKYKFKLISNKVGSQYQISLYSYEGANIPDGQGQKFIGILKGLTSSPDSKCCVILTPKVLPDVTPSITPSLSILPTITPSLSILPTITPSLSIQPTVTPSLSILPTVTPTPTKTPNSSIGVSVTPTPSNESIDATPSLTPSFTPSLTPTLTPTLTPIIPLLKFQVVYSLVGAVETGSAVISSRLTGSLNVPGGGGPAAEPGRLISYVLTTDPTNPKEGAPNRLMFGVKRNNSYVNGNKGSFISASIKNLLPNKTYYYWIYDHNNDRYISESTERKVTTTPFKNLVGPYTYLGKFKTSPLTSSAYRFSASFASCVSSYSTTTLYYHVKSYNPDLFIHLGDMHYFDNVPPSSVTLETQTAREYESAWQTVFASGSGYQAKLGQESTWSRPNYMPLLIRDMAFEYMWDDHDYGPNDSVGTTSGPYSNPSKTHAQTVYRLIFPHYKLPGSVSTYVSASATVPTQAIYHSFKKGRLKFIATDNHSEASYWGDPESDSKRVWSQEQEDWFKSEMTDTSCPIKVWICTEPWNGVANTDPKWSGYSTYRKKIANFFTANSSSIGKIIILSGDAHMTAIDDGYHTPWYGTGSKVNPPMAIYQSAPIDRSPGFKRGMYILSGADLYTYTGSLYTVSNPNYSNAINGLASPSSSFSTHNNRYGCMEVYDDGLSTITMNLYSRSGVTRTYSPGGDYRFPLVNNRYNKWRLTFDVSQYNINGNGGKIIESSQLIDYHNSP